MSQPNPVGVTVPDHERHLNIVPTMPEVAEIVIPDYEVTEYSVESLTSPNDPMVSMIDMTLFDNRKWMHGYEIAGAEVVPDRESRLRVVRNVIGIFPEYQDFGRVSPNTLLSHAKYLEHSKRTINKVSKSVAEHLSDRGQSSIDEVFLRLVEAKDPLAVTLARIYQDPQINERVFASIYRDSIVAFHRDEVKNLIDLQLNKLRIGKVVIEKQVEPTN